MFTKNKDDSANGVSQVQDAVRGASSKPASRVGASIICSDVKIVGSIESQGAVQIDGQLEGNITASDVTIGASGHMIGEVHAESLRVKGVVEGTIRARRVELESGAQVTGDILHGALIIHPEASFEGQVKRQDNPLNEASSSNRVTPLNGSGDASQSNGSARPLLADSNN